MNDLREALKRHDPGADAALTPTEAAHLRESLDAARAPRASLRLAGAFAALTLVVLVLAALWNSRRETQQDVAVTPLRGEKGQVARAAGADRMRQPARTREMQVTTPGGTRVIWVFNDDFRM